MSTDKVKQTDSQVSPNELLDHSVLANHALYDRFYFSTFATRGSETPDTVFEKFMNGSTPLASQAFQPYLPGGKSVADAKAELFAAGKPKEDAYKTAAEYQMIQGPFNVNSTSVQAWKAVLASMNKSEIITLWAKTNKIERKKGRRGADSRHVAAQRGRHRRGRRFHQDRRCEDQRLERPPRTHRQPNSKPWRPKSSMRCAAAARSCPCRSS